MASGPRLMVVLEAAVVAVLVLAFLAVAGTAALAVRRLWTTAEHRDE